MTLRRVGGLPVDLDRLERQVDVLRAWLACDGGSLGWWDRDAGVLRTLVNVGSLAHGAERRPADERHALRDLPALRALLEEGTPYLGETGAAAAVEHGGRTWGELRVTRSSGERAPIDLAAVVWAARSLALLLAEPPRAAPAPASLPGRYELRVRGRISPAAAAAFDPLTPSFEHGQTVLRGPILDRAQLFGHLERAQALGLTPTALAPLPDDLAP